MQKNDPLIHTKLHLPFTRSDLVPRPRLQEQIAQGLNGPLTLVTAPAGFGKTTLVGACVTGCGMPVAWLSLDKEDNQVGRFLNYLVAAFDEVDHSLGSEARQLLAASQQAHPEAILTSLINDLDRADREIVLVLDDYQYISSQAIHDVMIFFLEHCPNKLHIVIATRSDPPLPIARFRARGQVVDLRAADLRFTVTEAAQFLNDVMGLQLDGGAVAALEARTEGWIAGLQMAALSMRDREDKRRFIDGFSGTNRYILDYLLEEVLASQPPEIQHFLLHSSILERLTAPLCDFLLTMIEPSADNPEGAQLVESRTYKQSTSVLEYLVRANLFLVQLDDERTWYRYHHLFADLLCARLRQSQPQLAPRLHRRAAAWLEAHNYIPEAIHHLFAAEEVEQAAGLIERYGPLRLEESDPTVFQLASLLPEEMIVRRPRIGLYQTWLLIIEGRIPQARQLMGEMTQHLAAAGASNEPVGDEPAWMQTVIATAQAFLAPTGALEKYPLPESALLDDIPGEERLLRNAVDFLYGMALARRGDVPRAVAFALQVIEREKQHHGADKIPTLASFVTRVYLMIGRLHECAAMCREFLGPLQEQGIRFVYTSGSMKVDLGEVHYEWNHLEEAEQYIREGLEGNDPWHNIMTDGFGLVALARLLRAKGAYAEAFQVVEKLENRLRQSALPREFEEDYLTLRARLLLASGNLPGATHWADEVERSPDFELHPEHYRLTLGRVRLAQGHWAKVEALLAGFTPWMTSGSRISRQVECDLLVAAARAKLGRLPEAFSLLAAALALAEPEGYVRIFLDVGEPARELLAAYLRAVNGQDKPYARQILEAFGHTGQPGASEVQPTGGLIEPLSGRELEVLAHLALGRTNQEIARQLIISPGTVKAHTASIYRKLEVANRTEAVGKARELGILG